MSGTCATYLVVPQTNTTSTVSFTDCSGNATTYTVTNPQQLDVFAQTGTVSATAGATVTLVGSVTGGAVGTFWWTGCDGTPTTETVHPGAANKITRCAIDTPQQPAGQTGTITQVTTCVTTFYRAKVCGTNKVVFLQASATVGTFTIGQVVQFTPINTENINTGSATETLCATIDSIDLGTGGDGVINLQASGCGDQTNCPQAVTVYKWRFNSNSPTGGSATQLACNSVFCFEYVYTTASSTQTTVAGSTRFYRDVNLLLPFQGQNNYYGAVAPAVGQTVADMDFNKAILRMDDSGFATEIADNC